MCDTRRSHVVKYIVLRRITNLRVLLAVGIYVDFVTYLPVFCSLVTHTSTMNVDYNMTHVVKM